MSQQSNQLLCFSCRLPWTCWSDVFMQLLRLLLLLPRLCWHLMRVYTFFSWFWSACLLAALDSHLLCIPGHCWPQMKARQERACRACDCGARPHCGLALECQLAAKHQRTNAWSTALPCLYSCIWQRPRACPLWVYFTVRASCNSRLRTGEDGMAAWQVWHVELAVHAYMQLCDIAARTQATRHTSPLPPAADTRRKDARESALMIRWG